MILQEVRLTHPSKRLGLGSSDYFHRDKAMALEYFSLPMKSLQKLGDEHGITRERVRQVCNKVLRRSGISKVNGDATYDLRSLRGDEKVIEAINSLSL